MRRNPPAPKLRPGLWPAIKAAGQQGAAHKSARMGAALAYYSVFSLGPLIVVVISIAALIFDRSVVQREVIQALQGLLGDRGSEAVNAMLSGAGSRGEGWFASIIGTATLLFAPAGVVVQPRRAALSAPAFTLGMREGGQRHCDHHLWRGQHPIDSGLCSRSVLPKFGAHKRRRAGQPIESLRRRENPKRHLELSAGILEQGATRRNCLPAVESARYSRLGSETIASTARVVTWPAFWPSCASFNSSPTTSFALSIASRPASSA